MDKMVEQLESKAVVAESNDTSKEVNIFTREWKVYPKGVV